MAAEAGSGESSSRDTATDLLRRFGVARCRDAGLTHGVSGDEVELGLSLGGCFRVEPEKNRLVRASSISGHSIAKKCSLPMESEEEHRKRKGLQSLKRPEVKRSRTGAKQDSDRGAVDGLSRLRSISQRSVGSQGSSGLSDLDCQLEHGSSSYKEVNVPTLSIPLALIQANTIRSIEEDMQSKTTFEVAEKGKELHRRGVEEMPYKQSKERPGIVDKAKELERSRMEELESSRMEEMPCVSARGNGLNGRMIQGLLYKYGNGVDVRIVCVCHGSFLTPEEFVKHAGGGDVAHPLRHIIVSRPPFAF